MFIDFGIEQRASSVGATCARNQTYMPLPRSLDRFSTAFYKHVALTALWLAECRLEVFQQAVSAATRHVILRRLFEQTKLTVQCLLRSQMFPTSCERRADGPTDYPGDIRRKRISNLPICCSFSTSEFPCVGKTLKSGNHSKGELGKLIEWGLGCWRSVRDTHAIHCKLTPMAFCTSWTKVWATMLL